MNEDSIRRTVIEGLAQIAPEADFEALAPGESIRESLDIDSFDFLNFLIGLKENLGVEVPEADYERLVTLSDLLVYLSERLR